MVLFAFAALVLWLRYAAFPYIDNYRDDIVSSIERASGMRISVQSIRAGWGGLRPVVQLAWWALFVGQLRFTDVDFYHPELNLRRGSDGLVYLADKALNGAGRGPSVARKCALASRIGPMRRPWRAGCGAFAPASWSPWRTAT